MNNSKIFSAVCVMTAGILWGCMGLMVRPLNEIGLGSLNIVCLRSTITFLMVLILALIFDRGALKIRLKDLWCFLGTGIASVAFFNFCYFNSIVISSLSVAAVLLYTSPAFVIIISAICFKEKITKKKIIAVIIAFIGCALVSGIMGGVDNLSFKGIMFGLGSGFGYALYSIFSKFALNRGYSSLQITIYTFFFAMISTAVLGKPVEIVEKMSANPHLILRTFILVIVVTLIPYLIYTLGLKGLENGTASVIATVEPVAATINGIIFYKEIPDIWPFIGMVLVLGSIAIVNINTGKN